MCLKLVESDDQLRDFLQAETAAAQVHERGQVDEDEEDEEVSWVAAACLCSRVRSEPLQTLALKHFPCIIQKLLLHQSHGVNADKQSQRQLLIQCLHFQSLPGG